MKRALSLILLGLSILTASAQINVMLVRDAEERVTEYKTDDILEFDAADPMTVTRIDGTTASHAGVSELWFDQLAVLENAYEITGDVPEEYLGVKSVSDFAASLYHIADGDYIYRTVYSLADDVLLIYGEQDNSLHGVAIGMEIYKPIAGSTFRLTKSRLNDIVTISGDLQLVPQDEVIEADGVEERLAAFVPKVRMRVQLSLDPVTGYVAWNGMEISSFQFEDYFGFIGSALYLPVVGIGGGSPVIVLGDAEATDAAGMREGHYALKITVAGNRFKNGVIDLSDSDSYALTLYDYVEGKTYDITSHYLGNITTLSDPETGGENLYVNVDFTAPSGITLSANYYGPLTTVETLEGLEPQIAESNNVILTGVQDVNAVIETMQVLESTDGTYHLYFMTAGSERPDDSMAVPELQITPSMVNAGELSLPALDKQWRVRYKGIDLQYADNQWKPAITNGTLTVSLSEDGTWDVTLSLINEYNNMGSVSGSREHLDIHYRGVASAYTGTKK